MVPLLVLLNLGDIPGVRYQIAVTVPAAFFSPVVILLAGGADVGIQDELRRPPAK